jgi:NAD(P)-dependent dehydrogenase (short-subunit alcohol dehydrogenase family)
VAEVQADVSDPDDIAAMLDWIAETFGRLDVVVSGVSTASDCSALSGSADEYLSAVTSDARALLLLAQAARPLLAESQGSLIAVSRTGNDSTRAAVDSAVRRLAEELHAADIRVNGVESASGADVAGTVLYLASPLSRGVTGQTIAVGDAAVLCQSR